MSVYIKQLKRMVQENADTTQLSKPALDQRFLDWFDSVPEVSRYRAYSMVELEQALGTQGRYLSPILLRFGWQRRRKWSSRGQYHRYWVPPSGSLQGSIPPPY